MNYLDNYNIWNSKQLEDLDLIAEMKEIEGNDKEIKERFIKMLEFGTAGLRGVLGVGTNRMNIYTVALATQGMADYVKQQYENPTVAIAYDSRIKSDLFARITARVFAANGVKAYLFKELMPTPTLSFAVRQLHCSAGIVITASHNPSQYNGYKAYGDDGCQLNPEAAAKVLELASKTDIFEGVKKIPLEEGLRTGMIEYISDELVDQFLDRVFALRVNRDPIEKSDLKVVYTPLNGTGNKLVRRILGRMGIENIYVVKEQELPDGHFPTCTYPNPEEKATLQLGIELCKKVDGDLVLATDPDADRVGIAVKHHGEYILPTGNEVGVLMLDYIAKQRIAQGTMPKNPIAVKSIVSTPLADEVAKSYGIEMISVLTGFKYIGEQITMLAQKGEEDRFLLGFEESYGYMTGGHVRDKDAVNGSMIICEMAEYYKKQGKTLIDVLNEIFDKFGVYAAKVKGYTFEGTDGMEKMANIMKQLRENPPKEFAGYQVLSRADYKTSQRINVQTGEETAITLPTSNVLEYNLENNLKVIVRPSGTEPKIKVYLTIVTNDRPQIDVIAQKLFESAEALMA
ncbi:phospho-sugar mutase [uncultured Negativibacillus sp.]|uniref:phospho-sugar mutase n=1 Tax=uncultured Negativibacillus sp. TaxID=1980696 RepID=UPI0026002CEB|nr:phospho-sugar mutase [uncultured Negativibacillus sp.]